MFLINDLLYDGIIFLILGVYLVLYLGKLCFNIFNVIEIEVEVFGDLFNNVIIVWFCELIIFVLNWMNFLLCLGVFLIICICLLVVYNC